jgi:hypothetical protein
MRGIFKLNARVEKLMKKEWQKSYGTPLVAATQLLRTEGSSKPANAANTTLVPQQEPNDD